VVSVLPLVAACSMQTQLNSFFNRDDHTEATASITRLAPTPAFAGTDLAAVGAAASPLLDRNGGEAGSWENPLTGARGTITPLATPYRDNGIECRDFLASHVHEKIETWMQGEACRNRLGHWEVRDVKPWRR
jgi:hypothetical protein